MKIGYFVLYTIITDRNYLYKEKGENMKLKLGLLLTALVLLQAPIQAVGEMTPAQEKAALLGAAAKANLPQSPGLPQGITAEQQAKVLEIQKNISKIAESMDKDIIPVVESAVKNRSFGFFEGATIAGKLALTIGPAIYGAIDAIIDLHKANPSARAIIKNNLEGFFKAAKYDALVARLTGLVGKLPDGVIKDQLVKYAPKLNEIPRLIATQL